MGSQRFPSTGFDDRMGRLRADGWSTASVVLVHSPENICYLTGHETPGYYVYQCLVVPAVGEAVLMMRETETVNARIYSYLEDIHGYSDTVDPVDVTLEVLRDRGFDLRTVGLEERSWFLPPAFHRRLVGALGTPAPVPIDNLVSRLRLVKSMAEIEAIRAAARIASIAMREALAMVESGVRERDVAATIFAALMREGSEYLATEPYVASGRSGSDPFKLERPSDRRW